MSLGLLLKKDIGVRPLFNMGSNIVALIAVAAAAAIPAGLVGYNKGFTDAAREQQASTDMFRVREIFLYHEVGAARQAQQELISQIETLWDVEGEARRQLKRALAVQKRRADDYKLAASAAIKRLDNAENIELQTWRGTTVPDELTLPICVHVDGSGECQDSGPPAHSGDSVEIREPATSDGG